MVTKWLETVASKGDWPSIATLRKGACKIQGRLRDASGSLVSSEVRAETFADFHDSIQWRVRDVTLVPDVEPPVRPTLPVNCDPFTERELQKAICKMGSGKAVKEQDIPVECFKALAESGDVHLQWLLSFCNECLSNKSVPNDWSTSSVALLFKKGDPSSCDNYRSICLQSIGYKLFAWMLKERLVQAGVDQALWKSQFGFRPGCGTDDAIFIARRHAESPLVYHRDVSSLERCR